MDRTNDPVLLEQAMQLLEHYRDKLSYDKITIINEKGTLLYSTDSLAVQQQGVESLLGALEDITYVFVIGVPRTIIVQDIEKCLVIKPIFVESYGTVDGWMIAVGDCRTLECAQIPQQLRNQLEGKMKEDLSEKLETESVRSKLEQAFELPKIIGEEIALDFDTSITLDGDKGLVIQSYMGTPWGIATKSGRKYPDAIQGLEEMDMNLQMDLGLYDEHYEPPPKVDLTKLDYSKSNNLLIATLVYSALLMLPAIVQMTLEYAASALVILVVDIVIIFFILMSRIKKPIRIDAFCPCFFLIIGAYFFMVGIDSVFGYKDSYYLYWLFISFYLFMIVITLVVNVREQGRFGGELSNPSLITPENLDVEIPEQISPPLFQEEDEKNEPHWTFRFRRSIGFVLFIILYSATIMVLSPETAGFYLFGDIVSLTMFLCLRLTGPRHNEWICTKAIPCFLFLIGLILIFTSILDYTEFALFPPIIQISAGLYLMFVGILFVIIAWELGKLQ
ncbi:MAG: hypothetical protein ACFFF9_11730 [Candidatus Thorarchaeota archaeon]